jgi:hypothetical protein
MRHIVLALGLIIGCPAPHAFADFVMTPAIAPPAVSSTGGVARGQTEGEPVRPVVPTFKVAEGFGDKVPLSFAVRQIVPKAVKVSFGPGADPTAVVDWKGGRPWNQVLRDAVAPLGLRLVMTNMAVEIRRK